MGRAGEAFIDVDANAINDCNDFGCQQVQQDLLIQSMLHTEKNNVLKKKGHRILFEEIYNI